MSITDVTICIEVPGLKNELVNRVLGDNSVFVISHS